MANQNIILAKIIDHTPLSLNFESNQQAVLDPTIPLASVWSEMIAYLKKNNRPVYVETDAANVITKLYAPQAALVWEIEDAGEGHVSVSFKTSSAFHQLNHQHPDFQKMLNALQEALDKNIALLVTSANNFEIIDVRPLPASFEDKLLQTFTSPKKKDKSPEVNKPVSPERAEELFKMMQQKSCKLHDADKTCIPFKFPADGCWVRAHLMCFFLKSEKETPGKIWSKGKPLYVKTANLPECFASWPWHVAATLVVKKGEVETTMVFDPSMCDGPVTVNQWLLLQTYTDIKYDFSDSEQWSFFGGEATEDEANEIMQEFRGRLNTLIKESGPQPYKWCSL